MLKNAVSMVKNIGKSRSRSASREKIIKDSAVQASPSSREAAQVVKSAMVVAGEKVEGTENQQN